jgi:hypothetical protein
LDLLIRDVIIPDPETASSCNRAILWLVELTAHAQVIPQDRILQLLLRLIQQQQCVLAQIKQEQQTTSTCLYESSEADEAVFSGGRLVISVLRYIGKLLNPEFPPVGPETFETFGWYFTLGWAGFVSHDGNQLLDVLLNARVTSARVLIDGFAILLRAISPQIEAVMAVVEGIRALADFPHNGPYLVPTLLLILRLYQGQECLSEIARWMIQFQVTIVMPLSFWDLVDDLEFLKGHSELFQQLIVQAPEFYQQLFSATLLGSRHPELQARLAALAPSATS